MIEPTDEMLTAFLAAWDHENRVISDSAGEYVETGARDRAGLAAVLAIVDPSPAWAKRVRDADDCIWTRVPDAPMVWCHEDPIFGNRTAADIVRTAGPVEWLP